MTVIVVMGVASSGKTTIAAGLAKELGWPFRDADSFHPPANVAKMSAGIPLEDADRWPWLDAIVAWMNQCHDIGEDAVVTCSALKRGYRDRLRTSRATIRLVHLSGTKALLAARIAARKAHFMPPALLDSQFATLELPEPDEEALTISVAKNPKAILAELVRTFR
jgi:carbohydrate kinase (thermoresistant glucokinase family)